MKKKELEKIKGQSAAELTKDIEEKREKLWQIKNDIAVGKNKNVRAAKTLRRDIARAMTVLNTKKSENK